MLELEPALKSQQTGAVYYPQDGRVDPGALLKALKAGILAKGGEIIEDAEASAVSGGLVKCDGLQWKAKDVVLATGAWTQGLLPRVPIQAAKGYSVSQECGPGSLSIPMILTEEKVTVTPMPGKIRFGGTLSLSGLDASIDPRRLRPILDQADLYRESATSRREETWSGFRPCSPDGLPILGRVPGQNGNWVASGHGMMGLSLGPGTGRLMADLITGNIAEKDAAAFSPARFS